MGKVRIESFTLSIDGYGAGPDQTLALPMGVGGGTLHGWAMATPTFRRMFGQSGGTDGIDESFAQRGFRNIGAWILGRNMFGPVRGPWPDDTWRGWWGDEPPYHVPVFVLTHHARPPLEMAGGTVFHFVTEGADVALQRALAAAGDKDVRVGGGVATLRHYLGTGAIDEMHLAISPVLLGRGEALWAGLDFAAMGYRLAKATQGEGATHLILVRA